MIVGTSDAVMKRDMRSILKRVSRDREFGKFVIAHHCYRVLRFLDPWCYSLIIISCCAQIPRKT